MTASLRAYIGFPVKWFYFKLNWLTVVIRKSVSSANMTISRLLELLQGLILILLSTCTLVQLSLLLEVGEHIALK